VSASIGLICMTLKKLGLTTEKKSLQAAERNRCGGDVLWCAA